eukprot:gene31790-38429_t
MAHRKVTLSKFELLDVSPETFGQLQLRESKKVGEHGDPIVVLIDCIERYRYTVKVESPQCTDSTLVFNGAHL